MARLSRDQRLNDSASFAALFEKGRRRRCRYFGLTWSGLGARAGLAQGGALPDRSPRPDQPPAYAPLRNCVADVIGIELRPWEKALQADFDDADRAVVVPRHLRVLPSLRDSFHRV